MNAVLDNSSAADARPHAQPPPDQPHVLLAHGGGGELTAQLIRDSILARLSNPALAPLTDAAVLSWTAGHLAFTTDSYVVTPLEFPGGDIGRLAVAGTVNDLAVMGADPVALSLGLILEEGLPLSTLDRVIDSIAHTAREANVNIVTGDTKVIEARGAGLMINTAGVGRMRPDVRLDVNRIDPGDAVLVSGTLADHGLTIMAQRNGIEFDSELASDAAPLNGLVCALLDCGADVKFLRDATRGGLAGVLADVCERRQLSIEIDEDQIPIRPTALRAAELLGLDPLTVANEGKLVAVVASRDADRALRCLRTHPLGQHAARIGSVTDAAPALVELITRIGGRRIVQRPYGEELPRIC